MPKRSSSERSTSYSVDEMMEKLREGERAKRRSEDSEVVTRPDGSKVVRVRKRRRRTAQPHKKKQVRRKRFAAVGVLALLLMLVGLAATIVIVLARFNSKGYRDELKEGLYSATGAKATIEDLAVTPLRVRAKSMKFTWPGSGIAKSLKLNGIFADLELSSFIGAEWTGKEVLATSGSLFLGPPDGTITPVLTDGELPFDFGGFRCSNTDIVFGKYVDEPAIQVAGTEMTMRRLDGGGVQFLVRGGRANIGIWEELRISRGLAEMRDGNFELVSLRVTPSEAGAGGEATVRSELPARAGSPAAFKVDLVEYPIETLLGTDAGLGRMINGMVGTSEKDPGIISGDPRFLDSGTVSIRFKGEAVALQDFQFLSGLSDLLRRDFYARPIGTMSGVLKQDQDGTRIQNLEFNAKSDLKLADGNIELTHKGDLLGSLRVGVPEALVMRNETQKRLGFGAFSKPDALGYCWLDIKLRGSAGRPLDTFGDVLKAGPAAPEATEDASKSPSAEEVLENEFDRLVR